MVDFLLILGAHWIADFILQTHWQATNKSKRLSALAAHVGVYTGVMAIATLIIIRPTVFSAWLGFVLLNGALHFATDFFTSRATSLLWARGDTHNFFAMVGFDQYIHQVTLALTVRLFFGWA